MAKKHIEIYIPKSIDNIMSQIPDKVQKVIKIYDFDNYAEPYIKKTLWRYGITKNKFYYDDCYSNASVGYIYSVCRCAFCNYDYVVPYIRKMIKITIVDGIVIANEFKNICKENNFRATYLDDDSRYNW